MIQTTQTALANGRGKIKERLGDGSDGGRPYPSRRFLLTHEVSSTMLGVRSTEVTVALRRLELANLELRLSAAGPQFLLQFPNAPLG